MRFGRPGQELREFDQVACGAKMATTLLSPQRGGERGSRQFLITRRTSRASRLLALASVLGLILPLAWLSFADPAFAQQGERCALDERQAPLRPQHFSAKVRGVAPPEEVQRQTHIAELRTGGAVSPDYAGLPRILAVFVVDGVAHTTIAAVIDGRIPQPGETVELKSRYRDPRSPCNFIPWTVVPASTVSRLGATAQSFRPHRRDRPFAIARLSLHLSFVKAEPQESG